MKKIIRVFAIVAVVALGVIAGLYFGKSSTKYDGTTTELGFKDIGELATQSAYATEVQTIDKEAIKLWKVKIPFTQSNYVYSYNVNIKAGYEFGDIEWDVDDTNKVITIHMPETKILSTEIDHDSFKIYTESDGIGQKITMNEINESDKELIKRAQKDAIENGLYENAQENAKTIINNMVYQHFDSNEYTIEYDFK